MASNLPAGVTDAHAHFNLPSAHERETELTCIDCPKCGGSGRLEYETVDVRYFFDPFQTVEGPCDYPGCQGGEIEIETCKACGAQVDDCKCDDAGERKEAA